ncbi:unnamed protein product [Macrosiphum euphorbiae]|uniref:Uncharacterized protein n=1 Tax=Macrosiphum euphorbiae TaxID=13131 RepID=A0AAV0Y5I5_9HEMI|nr:unnamed protein product [Macrosiphum euphorbiae]
MSTPRAPNASSKASTSSTDRVTRSKASTSNEDLLNIILSFKSEVLASNKALSSSQSSQFNSLKSEILKISEQMSELKNENAILKEEIGMLKLKMNSLEEKSPSTNPSAITNLVLQELFERDHCSSNVIAHGVSESTSSLVAERAAYDKSTISNILLPLGDSLPLNLKFIRIGKPRPNSTRPLKLVCASKEEAKSLLYQYNELKRSGTQFQNGFNLVKDKTQLERQQLRSCHEEMTARAARGELNLRIYFENGSPKVGTIRSKNEHHLPQLPVH